ncbi:MAG: hypothetical protein EP336_09505 [Rhodobacteraceae bacterium]|nr:MAG: hypothetical protein EP336_09505 [Paracoccaceae bacterium]
MSDLPARLKIRRGSALQWQTVNPILASGELGYELDTKRLRIGDGVSSFTSLPFIEAGNATLSALAQITLGSSTSKSLEGGAVLFSGDVDSISPTGPRRVALEAIGTKPVETAYTDFTIRYDDDTIEQMAFTSSGIYQRSMIAGDWTDWENNVFKSEIGTIAKQDADDMKAGIIVATPHSNGDMTSGILSPDVTNGNIQTVGNNGAFQIDPPSVPGWYTMILQVVNGPSPGIITFGDGFQVGYGDKITTVPGDAFSLRITKEGDYSTVVVVALQ